MESNKNSVSFENLLLSVDERILTITVNRPDKLNALNFNTVKEIGMAVNAGIQDSSVRGMIITGSGNKAFVAGADITEFVGLNIAEAKELSRHGQKVFELIENSPKPVIAAVNGFALGGGCELAMACHLRIASANAKFGQPEVKLGIIPGYGGTQRLVQLIGKTNALRYMMTAEMISAEEAFRLCLLNEVTTSENLITAARALMEKIKIQSPKAVSGVISSVNGYFSEGIDGYAKEVDEFGKCFLSEDFIEGTSAFIEKRTPQFKD